MSKWTKETGQFMLGLTTGSLSMMAASVGIMEHNSLLGVAIGFSVILVGMAVSAYIEMQEGGK